MTDEQVTETGRAAYRAGNYPPMPDEVIAKVGALLAPLNDQPIVAEGDQPKSSRAA